ncbi:septum formation initiator family protein [Anaeromicrobium sediminis]|uniref:septum formation initiator family protein n=1 Tax=Anaeromicrobium sediminis TaxID=1478221 RepID=UPI0015961277|nr:cell division protein FtsL [Anaeromicrobium sediminis]
MLVAKRKYSYYEENIPEREEKKQIENKTNRKNKKGDKLFFYKVQTIVTLLITATFCVGILAGYAEISKLKYEVNNLAKESKKAQSEINRLKVEIDKVKRSDLIEEKANTTLGMQYPEKRQMVFLEVDDFDLKRNLKQDTKIVEETSFMDVVKGTMGKMITSIKGNFNI